jgi:hypothetical protein
MVVARAISVEAKANGARAVPLCEIALWNRPGKAENFIVICLIQ